MEEKIYAVWQVERRWLRTFESDWREPGPWEVRYNYETMEEAEHRAKIFKQVAPGAEYKVSLC